MNSNDRESVIICKNPECEDFNCFVELHNIIYNENAISIKEGLTGELVFENEQGKFYERYKNGRIDLSIEIE